MEYLDKLTQQRAPSSIQKVALLIIAGAGSANRCSTYRDRPLKSMPKGCRSPSNSFFDLLLISAAEMRTESNAAGLRSTIRDGNIPLGLCKDSSSWNPGKICVTLPDFTIYDADDSNLLIRVPLSKEMRLDVKSTKANELSFQIFRRKKCGLVLLASYQKWSICQKGRWRGRIEPGKMGDTTRNTKTDSSKSRGSDGFRDLLFLLTCSSEIHPWMCSIQYQRDSYVDWWMSFRDTQLSIPITKKLEPVHQNICCGGDDAGVSMPFRGADIKYPQILKMDYPWPICGSWSKITAPPRTSWEAANRSRQE